MAELFCDICGGKIVVGSGGVVSCEECGSKYSKERLLEKIKESEKSIPRDENKETESTKIKEDNYYELAKTAFESNNFLEAEAYCNKALELNPNNYEVYFTKGAAVIKQSTLAKKRLNEGYVLLAKSLLLAPENKKDEIKNKMAIALSNTIKAIFYAQTNQFKNNMNIFEGDDFIEAYKSLCSIIMKYQENISNTYDFNPLYRDIINYYDDLVSSLYSSGGPLSKTEYYDRDELIRNVKKLDAIVKVTKGFINNTSDVQCLYTLYLTLYLVDNLIDRYELLVNVDYSTKHVPLQNANQKHELELRNKEYDVQIKKYEELSDKSKAKEFWDCYPDKYIEYTKKEKDLKLKLEEFINLQKNDPAFIKKKELEKKISDLNKLKSEAGILAFKQKKAYQEQIDSKTKELKDFLAIEGDRLIKMTGLIDELSKELERVSKLILFSTKKQ